MAVPECLKHLLNELTNWLAEDLAVTYSPVQVSWGLYHISPLMRNNSLGQGTILKCLHTTAIWLFLRPIKSNQTMLMVSVV